MKNSKELRMLTTVPACRRVCKDAPGTVMDELVEALAKIRNKGLSEAEALLLIREATVLANLFPEGSLGRHPKVAESFIQSGCAECAVNKAYSR
jgi:hypothetical protein